MRFDSGVIEFRRGSEARPREYVVVVVREAMIYQV